MQATRYSRTTERKNYPNLVGHEFAADFIVQTILKKVARDMPKNNKKIISCMKLFFVF